MNNNKKEAINFFKWYIRKCEFMLGSKEYIEDEDFEEAGLISVLYDNYAKTKKNKQNLRLRSYLNKRRLYATIGFGASNNKTNKKKY